MKVAKEIIHGDDAGVAFIMEKKNNSFVPLFSTFNALVIAANNPKCSQLTEPYPPTCPQVMSKKMRPAHYLTETHQHTQSNTGEPTQHRQPWAFGVKQENSAMTAKPLEA